MGLLYGRRRGSSRVWLDFARIVSYNILAWIPRVSAVSAALARRHPCQNRIPGCSAVGSAPALGAGCRGFESLHSDQNFDRKQGLFSAFGHFSFSEVSKRSPPLESNRTCISQAKSAPRQAFFISLITWPGQPPLVIKGTTVFPVKS